MKWAKSLIYGLLIWGISIITVCAASDINSAEFNKNKVIYNGTELNMGGQPMISVVKDGDVNASNYMPVRTVLEQMGYNVNWDAANQAIVINSAEENSPKDNQEIENTQIKSAVFNTNKVIYNGTELNINSQPMISVVRDGETNASNYMPVRAVLEQMGYSVSWDAENQAIIINTNTENSLSADNPDPINIQNTPLTFYDDGIVPKFENVVTDHSFVYSANEGEGGLWHTYELESLGDYFKQRVGAYHELMIAQGFQYSHQEEAPMAPALDYYRKDNVLVMVYITSYIDPFTSADLNIIQIAIN